MHKNVAYDNKVHFDWSDDNFIVVFFFNDDIDWCYRQNYRHRQISHTVYCEIIISHFL